MDAKKAEAFLSPRVQVAQRHRRDVYQARGLQRMGLLVTLEDVTCVLTLGPAILPHGVLGLGKPKKQNNDKNHDVEAPVPQEQTAGDHATETKRAWLQTTKLQVLTNVSVAFEPCHLTALLGPSGSGKTTLLDVASGRKTRGTLTGSIRFSGVAPTAALLKRETAYVEQSDVLLPALTVREMLMYQSELKRSPREGAEPKRERVRELLHRLGLSPCADTRIGCYMDRGISGGQARRVNIALALVTDPSVLFLDEPTSGLDSTTSLEVCCILRGIADGGRTVITTIHSPSAEVFRLFDDVVLLARGGVVAYSGRVADASAFVDRHAVAAPAPAPAAATPTGSAAETESSEAVFERHASSSSLGMSSMNVSELLLASVSDRDAAHALCTAYAASELAEANARRMKALLGAIPKDKQGLVEMYGRRAAKTLLRATSAASVELVASSPAATGETSDRSSSSGGTASTLDSVPSMAPHRRTGSLSARAGWRAVRRFFGRDTQTSTATAVRVMLKYRMTANLRDVKWIATRCAPLFFAAVVAALYANTGGATDPRGLMDMSALLFLVAGLPAFAAGGYMPSILEERAVFYRERADGCYSTAAFLFYKLVEEAVASGVMSVGFSLIVFYSVGLGGSVLYFAVMVLATMLVGIVLAYLVAAVCPTANAATTVFPVFVTTHLFFVGLLLDITNLPPHARWVADVAFIRYTWDGLMLNEFGENDPPFFGGSVLQFYHIRGDKWTRVGVMAAFFCVYMVLAYCALAFVRHMRR